MLTGFPLLRLSFMGAGVDQLKRRRSSINILTLDTSSMADVEMLMERCDTSDEAEGICLVLTTSINHPCCICPTNSNITPLQYYDRDIVLANRLKGDARAEQDMSEILGNTTYH